MAFLSVVDSLIKFSVYFSFCFGTNQNAFGSKLNENIEYEHNLVIRADSLHFLCFFFCLENEDEFEGVYGKLDLSVLKKIKCEHFIFVFYFRGVTILK